MPEHTPAQSQLVAFDHPLIHHKIAQLRDSTTQHQHFRSLMTQIAGLMTYELTRTFPTKPVQVQTPIETATCHQLAGTITLVPVLRAGLGMTEGVLELMPEARVGHIGLFRDEQSLEPVEYLSKLPSDLDAGPVVLVDPMLATGGSASKALTMLREQGAKDLRMMCLVAAPEGVERIAADHPDVTVYTGCLDRQLNEQGYIMPGLGDAGDRLFGTA